MPRRPPKDAHETGGGHAYALSSHPVDMVIVMTMGWEMLSAREGTRPSGLRDGVPASVEPHLRRWIAKAVREHVPYETRLMVRLDLTLPESYSEQYNQEYAAYEARRKAAAAAAAKREEMTGAGSNQALMLTLAEQSILPPSPPTPTFLAQDTPTSDLFDVIDAILSLVPYHPPTPADADPVARVIAGARRVFGRTDPRKELQQLLLDARSIYSISADGHRLERRVSVTTAAATANAGVAAVRAGRVRAAERLHDAWAKTYSIHPDPSGAYRDAVLAVEAIANPFFLPADPEPTLGRVLRHLEDAVASYQLVIPGRSGDPSPADAVIGMIGTLWWGHRDRHEGGPSTASITQESAEAALSLASTLVHWLATGVVVRVATNKACLRVELAQHVRRNTGHHWELGNFLDNIVEAIKVPLLHERDDGRSTQHGVGPLDAAHAADRLAGLPGTRASRRNKYIRRNRHSTECS